MRPFAKRKSAWQRFLLLDVLLVVAMLLCSAPVYGRMLADTQREVVARSHLRAQQAAEKIDATVINLLSTASTLRSQEDLGKLALHEGAGELPDALYYTLYRAKKQAQSAYFAYDQVGLAMIFFKRNPMLVTNRQCFTDRAEFFERFIESDEGAQPLEAELTASFRETRLLPSRPLCLQGEFIGKERMPLLISGGGSGEGMLMCALLDTEALLRDFGWQESGAEGFILLLDEEGNALASLNAPQDWSASDQYVRIEQRLATLSCRAVMGLPRAYFSQIMAPQRRLILVYSAILLVVGVALAASIAWRSARPVRELVSGLRLPQAEGQSEYSAIEDAFHTLNDSCEELRENATRLENEVVLSSLGQLLLGSALVVGQEERFQAELPRLRGEYRVVVVRIDPNGLQSGEDELLPARVTQALSDYEPLYPLSRTMLALLIRDDECEVLSERVARLSELLSRTQGAYVTAGVSPAERDVGMVSHAFALACDSLACVTEDQAVAVDVVSPVQDGTLSFELVRRFYDLLLSGAPEPIAGFLDELGAQGIVPGGRERKRFYYSMDLLLASAAAEHGVDADSVRLPPYTDALSAQELLGQVREAEEKLCALLRRRKESGNLELKRRVVEYVDAHFEEPELYADIVAEACGVSVKYLHRVFREYTGKSVCDYLEEKRMQRARTLLEEGDENISRISERCGFRSLNTFYKAFKRVNGLSPSEYRKMRAGQETSPDEAEDAPA
ncbi:MAG: AraC family transcriptional regulator [Eubacteriales bacterium]|nr:AraC family transcriptional regulator [Eubacteriales bacterium]